MKIRRNHTEGTETHNARNLEQIAETYDLLEREKKKRERETNLEEERRKYREGRE